MKGLIVLGLNTNVDTLTEEISKEARNVHPNRQFIIIRVHLYATE